MFAEFFYGWQQDIRLALIPPILCAIFRLIFICKDGPKKLSEWSGEQLKICFSYGFWWGLDINSR